MCLIFLGMWVIRSVMISSFDYSRSIIIIIIIILIIISVAVVVVFVVIVIVIVGVIEKLVLGTIQDQPDTLFLKQIDHACLGQKRIILYGNTGELTRICDLYDLTKSWHAIITFRFTIPEYLK